MQGCRFVRVTPVVVAGFAAMALMHASRHPVRTVEPAHVRQLRSACSSSVVGGPFPSGRPTSTPTEPNAPYSGLVSTVDVALRRRGEELDVARGIASILAKYIAVDDCPLAVSGGANAQ